MTVRVAGAVEGHVRSVATATVDVAPHAGTATDRGQAGRPTMDIPFGWISQPGTIEPDLPPIMSALRALITIAAAVALASVAARASDRVTARIRR